MTFDELVERTRSFQESRVLLTAVELDVFTAVGTGASAEVVARRLRTDCRATEMLLNALVAVGALVKSKGSFCSTPATARHLTKGAPRDQRAALMHTVHMWDRWSTLTQAVRVGTAVAAGEIAGRGNAWIEAFIAAMHRNAVARAPGLVKAVGVRGARRMLDVGGGSGAYSIAFAKANRRLAAEVFDLAEVLPIARRHIREGGLQDRVKTRKGDLRSNAFGKNYDLILISAICHMLSPEENLDLFRRSFRALSPGGRVVVQDFILEPDKTGPPMAALFSLNMLVGTRSGASYSEPEYAAWLREAGFESVRRVRFRPPAELMIGVRA